MAIAWIKSYQQIRSRIAKGEIAPIYFLHGAEDFFSDQIIQQIQSTPEFLEREKVYNFSGVDSSLPEIMTQAREIPMQGGQQLILVKNAQLLKQLPKLVDYAEKPPKFTIVVFSFIGKLSNPKWFQNLSKSSSTNILGISPIYENHLAEIISLISKEEKISLSSEGLQAIITQTGSELYKAQNILRRLKITYKESDTIGSKEIENLNVGGRTYSEFDLQKAIALHQKERAFAITEYLSQNPKSHPLTKAVAILYRFVKNLIVYQNSTDKSEASIAKILGVHPFFVKEFQIASRSYDLRKSVKIMEGLHKLDLKSKGILGSATTTQSCKLLKEWVYLVFDQS